MAAFDVDFTLEQGEFTLAFHVHVDARALALFGPSGSGKTSALEAVAGLRTPRRGRIAVNGHVLVDTEAHVNIPVRHRRTGYVPQDILPSNAVGAHIIQHLALSKLICGSSTDSSRLGAPSCQLHSFQTHNKD